MNTKELWTLIRQHSARRAPPGHPQPWKPQPLAASLIKPPVPRGMAGARDAMVRQFCALRAVPADPLTLPLAFRGRERLTALYVAEIARRGGEVEIAEQNREIGVHILHRAGGLTVLGCDGWRWYGSRHPARPASLRYLCGRDDNGRWAARVPGTCNTVAGALAWLAPAAVVAARAAGHRVARQGDVYLLGGGRRDRGFDSLPPSHIWDDSARTLRHPSHGHVAWGAEPVCVVPQRRFTEKSASRGFARD